MKGHSVTSSNERITMTTDDNKHMLIIKRCEVADAGTVSCVASNSVGRANCEAKLTVEEGKVNYISFDIVAVKSQLMK